MRHGYKLTTVQWRQISGFHFEKCRKLDQLASQPYFWNFFHGRTNKLQRFVATHTSHISTFYLPRIFFSEICVVALLCFAKVFVRNFR
jgi:hypothetical protein